MINKPVLAITLFVSYSIVWAQQATPISAKANSAPESSAENNTVIEQPVLRVTEYANQIPAPIQHKAEAVNATAGGASINTSDAWQRIRATNISDILASSTGVFAQQRNGAESARVSIRGSGLGRQFQGGGLLLLKDGVPLNNADGAFEFQAIDPWLTDYVTVYRGANGLTQGSSTLGGAIEFGSQQPHANESNILRLAAGSYNTQQAMLGWSTRVMDNTTTGGTEDAMRLRVSHFQQQGFRQQNQQNSNRIDWQYWLQTDQQLEHRLQLFHLNSMAELPSSLSRALIAAGPRQSRGFNISGNFHHNLSLTQVAYQFKDPTHTGIESIVYYAQKDLINPVFTYIDRNYEDAGLMFNWQQRHHQLRLHTQHGWQDELRHENDGGAPGIERLYREQQATTTTLLYQLQHTAWSDQITASWALQGVYASRDIDELRPQQIRSHRNYSQLNPRFGLLYHPSNHHQWFANLSRSFEPPSFAELNNGNQTGINAPIKAQSADTFELGSRGFNTHLQWDVSVYYSQLDNELIRFRFPNGDTKSTNADSSIHFGLEATLNAALTESWLLPGDQLQLKTSYLWNHFKLDNDPTYNNNHIPGIPAHHIRSQLSYQHPSGWQLSPNIEWVPSAYYIDLANSYRTENYLLTGLSFSYIRTNGWEFFIDAKNLNDQTYISTSLPIPDAGGSDGNYFYSGEGRAFYAGMKYLF